MSLMIGSEGFAKAGTLRSEYVVAIVGKVQKRSAAVNENLKNRRYRGVRRRSLRVLSEARDTAIPDRRPVSRPREELRLKYRYLDLRRPDLQRESDAAK